MKLAESATDAAFLDKIPAYEPPLVHRGEVAKHEGDDQLCGTAARTGTRWTVLSHDIVAMVGAGVLAFSHNFAILGWAGGIIVLFMAFCCSYYAFRTLINMHEVPATDDLEAKGENVFTRNNRYRELSEYVLGKRWGWIIQPFQITYLWGVSILYTVTGGAALHEIYITTAPKEDWPTLSLSKWILIFGALCIIVSMVRNFNDLFWVSCIGAATTIFYCTIIIGTSARYPLPRTGKHHVDFNYVFHTHADKIFAVFSSITSIMFAFGGHNIALEIQATLPGGTCRENSTIPRMQWAANITYTYAFILYFGCGISGYWAYGHKVGGNVLYTLGGPIWVRTWGGALIFVHMISSVQINSFPLHDMVEQVIYKCGHTVNWWQRVILRIAYGCITILLACLMPFFSNLMGLIGAIGILPTSYIFPCVLYMLLHRPKMNSPHFWICCTIIPCLSCAGILGAIGSVRGMYVLGHTFKIFA